jgi:hypothetical protein
MANDFVYGGDAAAHGIHERIFTGKVNRITQFIWTRAGEPVWIPALILLID